MDAGPAAVGEVEGERRLHDRVVEERRLVADAVRGGQGVGAADGLRGVQGGAEDLVLGAQRRERFRGLVGGLAQQPADGGDGVRWAHGGRAGGASQSAPPAAVRGLTPGCAAGQPPG
ncbi:hypothetical protein PQR15_22265 [Streptomyces lydicus]|nr:hypothetical protein [Streptomyces lydicus]